MLVVIVSAFAYVHVIESVESLGFLVGLFLVDEAIELARLVHYGQVHHAVALALCEAALGKSEVPLGILCGMVPYLVEYLVGSLLLSEKGIGSCEVQTTADVVVRYVVVGNFLLRFLQHFQCLVVLVLGDKVERELANSLLWV